MNKHTPGRWIFEVASNGSARILQQETRQLICAFPQKPGGKMGENIKLILAAPLLLAALEASTECAGILRNLIESIEKHGNYSAESTINFLNQALGCHYLSDAAIAKARGEA